MPLGLYRINLNLFILRTLINNQIKNIIQLLVFYWTLIPTISIYTTYKVIIRYQYQSLVIVIPKLNLQNILNTQKFSQIKVSPSKSTGTILSLRPIVVQKPSRALPAPLRASPYSIYVRSTKRWLSLSYYIGLQYSTLLQQTI